jgi:hypothetical protein
MMTRRHLLETAAGIAVASIAPGWIGLARSETFAVTHTDAE